NTILCLIAEIRDTGRFRVLDDLAEIVGLGQGVDHTGLISPEAQGRAARVLEQFVAHCQNLGVEEITAGGGSGPRGGKKKEKGGNSIRQKTGPKDRRL